MRYSGIVFDFFGVIATEVRHALIDAYAHTPEAQEAVHAAFEEADIGYMTLQELYEACAYATGRSAADIRRCMHHAGHKVHIRLIF